MHFCNKFHPSKTLDWKYFNRQKVWFYMNWIIDWFPALEHEFRNRNPFRISMKDIYSIFVYFCSFIARSTALASRAYSADAKRRARLSFKTKTNSRLQPKSCFSFRNVKVKIISRKNKSVSKEIVFTKVWTFGAKCSCAINNGQFAKPNFVCEAVSHLTVKRKRLQKWRDPKKDPKFL